MFFLQQRTIFVSLICFYLFRETVYCLKENELHIFAEILEKAEQIFRLTHRDNGQPPAKNNSMNQPVFRNKIILKQSKNCAVISCVAIATK